MADLTFNTEAGKTVARELLIAYLNTGTASTPVWSPLGKRVEDSSAELDWDSNNTRDILGATYGTLKKHQDAQALANLDMLIVHFYAGTASTPFAERYESCMVEVTGLGGEGGGNVGMPINVTYGGNRTTGTASKGTGGAITFTADQ